MQSHVMLSFYCQTHSRNFTFQLCIIFFTQALSILNNYSCAQNIYISAYIYLQQYVYLCAFERESLFPSNNACISGESQSALKKANNNEVILNLMKVHTNIPTK